MFAPEQVAAPQAAASSMNHSPSQSPIESKASQAVPHGLNARSCVTCRRRKVKCDKQKNGCSNCAKAGQQCVFPAPGRAPRRPRTGGKVVSEREAELLKRLRRLEGVVEELSGQVEIEAIKHSPSSDNSNTHKDGDTPGDTQSSKGTTVRVVGMDEGSGNRKAWISRSLRLVGGPPKTAFGTDELQRGVGRLVLDEGKSRYVASPFWAAVTDEVEEIKEMLDDQEFDSDSDAPIPLSDALTEPDHQNFIMGYSSSDVDLKTLHPLPSQIPFYWQTFLDNVQPLVKILHTPTMNKVIKEVQNNLDSLSKSTEALMFSIYFATITSMNTNEVQTNFGIEKEHLLKQYRFGVEQALAKASFLNTNEIVTVQAFVLFLVCVRRHDDTRFVWSLTGLALRIAQSLGLHRDGTAFGLSPFDTEMRRRLWWQVCILDTRASEDHGSDTSILDYSFDTKLPLSVNDDDLDRNATEPPVPREGVSEMTFCLIRYEICSLTRKINYAPSGETLGNLSGKLPLSLEEKEEAIRHTARHLERTYLQYCEDAGPLYWVAATIARLIIAKMSLIIYHPLTQPGKPNTLSQDIKDKLFMASIEILEYSRILESEATTKQWGWLFHTYIQWHAIAYILGELCTRPNSAIVERAWRAIDVLFSNWDGAVRQTKSGMLWQPMRKLIAKARRKREENMRVAAENGNSTLDLGIDSRYMRPPAAAYAQPSPCPGNIAQDRLMPGITSATTAHGSSDPTALPTSLDVPNNVMYQDDSFMMQPQVVGLGTLAPDQIQLQLQQQQAQQQAQQQIPWLMDDNALVDLDMNALDGDVNWEGWDDLVRDFQMEVDNQPERNGPSLMGMGSWW